MKIFFTWHAAVETEYRKLFQELRRLNVELLVLIPNEWTEGGRLQRYTPKHSDNYQALVLSVIFRDKIKRFFYPNLKALVRQFRQFRPDIVHIFEEPYSLACAQIVGLARTFYPKAKIVVQSFENLLPPHPLPFNLIERFILQRADALVIVPHEGEALWRARGFRGPIYQVPVGLDETLFKKTDAPLTGLFHRNSSLLLAYVGRLAKEKGVSILIEAFHYLIKEEMDVELLIIGNGSERNALGLMANQLGISSRVHFFDAFQSHVLPLLYSNIDILVLPSLTKSTWKEQFGRVLVEAMACEATVVGSSSGEIPYVVGDGGIIFPEGDLRALVRVLKELVIDSSLRERLGKVGRRRILQNFTWRSVAERLCSIYKEVEG
jgi:glycosyltransferase involved in cell wall biosynthesis